MQLFWGIALLGVASLACCWGFNLSEERLTATISVKTAEEISREYLKYLKTGIESTRLMELGAGLRASHSKKLIFTEPLVELSASNQFFVCTMCRATVNVLSRTFLDPEGDLSGPNRDEDAKKAALGFCEYFEIQTREVCDGLFDLNWPILDFILNGTIAKSQSICGMLPLVICQIEQDEFNFSLNIEGDLPTESKSELPAHSDKDLRILHLTDIHYDPEYLVGGLADCEEIMCCRDKLPEGATSAPAGKWSDYRTCDTPKHLIVNAFEHIRDNQKLDWIYHTGDVPPHNVWSTTRQGNLDMLTEIDELLLEHFPDTPIYSCLGNHEPHPANVFYANEALPSELNVNWLYEHVWQLWSRYLPAEAKTTVLQGGYYTALHSAGHRIITLNSMDCYLFNWWIFYNGSIVIEQLQWFHDTLLEAEKAGEHVHVLSHIPSGDADCWSIWSREYNRILTRFHKTITGIFTGHTHKDEMNLHYTPEGVAVAVTWNGGSLTPYSYKNPNYRVYEVNPDNWQVLEHETWICNVTAANELDAPKWYKEYEFTKEFTEDTSPAGIERLLLQMAEQPELLRKFWRLKFTNADPRLEKGCDNSCLKTTLCRLATTNYKERKSCRELVAILEEHLDDDTTTTTENPDKDDGAAALSAYSQLLVVLFGLLATLTSL